jgi:hypothetical protein
MSQELVLRLGPQVVIACVSGQEAPAQLAVAADDTLPVQLTAYGGGVDGTAAALKVEIGNQLDTLRVHITGRREIQMMVDACTFALKHFPDEA